ncbi:MAG: HD domain-containing protein [Blautia sp.]|jgi:uncharacterized protein
MERVNRIWNHPVYQECLRTITKLERTRRFCHHDWAHFLDVARLAYIENLEKGLGISKECIYACGLLHDIGRHLQYTEGTPHHEASAAIAGPILKDCGFTEEEQKKILEAILSHRNADVGSQLGLAGVIYRADKASRVCFACESESDCDWSLEKKNMELTV